MRHTPRVSFQAGTLFSVPLLEAFGTGLMLSTPTNGRLTCVFLDYYATKVPSGFPSHDLVQTIAYAKVWMEAFQSRRWIAVEEWRSGVMGFDTADDLIRRYSLPARVPTLNETVIEDLLAAYDGQRAWNDWEDELFFDSLLAPGTGRPHHALILKPIERRGRVRPTPRLS